MGNPLQIPARILITLIICIINCPAAQSKNKATSLQIASGSPAHEGEFPFAVQLHIARHGSRSFCGGSIITSKLILTAAHCVFEIRLGGNDSVKVVAGELNWYFHGPQAQIRAAIEIIAHEQYNHVTTENDLAILVLDSSLGFGHQIRQTLLPDLHQTFTGTARICGWGYKSHLREASSVLMKAEVPLVDGAKCLQAYGGEFKMSTMICAGGNISDACEGDSGGPLLCTSNSQQFLCGVTLGGSAVCGPFQPPGIYTNVAALSTWIRKVSGLSGKKVCDAGYFDCGNGICTQNSTKCNGQLDCPNGFDEFGCKASPTANFGSTSRPETDTTEANGIPPKIHRKSMGEKIKSVLEKIRNFHAQVRRAYDAAKALAHSKFIKNSTRQKQ